VRDLSSIIASWHVQHKCTNHGGIGDRRRVPRFFPADRFCRLGRITEALLPYEKALALARQEPERRFLARRLEELK